MQQRLHPDISWARPYAWREVVTDDLSPLGRVESIAAQGDELIAAWRNGMTCRAAAVAPGIVRLEWSHPDVSALPDNGGVTLPLTSRDPAAAIRMSEAAAYISTAGWKLTVNRDGGFAWGAAGRDCAVQLRSIALKQAERGMRMLACFDLEEGESIHGCGGRTGPVNRRGGTCDFFSVKVDGPKNGDYGGLPMPFIMTSRGAGLFLDNPWPHVYADFGYEDPSRMTWYAPGGPVCWYLIAGPEPAAIQRRWHELTGFPVMPPEWYFGLWMSYCAGTKATDWIGWMEKFRRDGWPLDVVVLDLEWRGGALIADAEGGDGTGLDWAPEFGDGLKLMQKAEELDLKVCLHLNTRQFGSETAERGVKEGWLRRVDEQVVIEPSTEARAEKAWALHRPRVEEGAQLWWTDNGERVEGELGEGLPSRNLFGARWNKFLFDRMEREGLKGRLVLSRGDWVGAQRHCTAWPGDTCPGVDRTDEDLRFILNCAVSGVPFSGTDLGGFHVAKKTDEVMSDRMRGFDNLSRRLVQSLLYQPIARIHGGAPVEKFPWALPEKLQPVFRLYAGLRYRLLDWWCSAAAKACEEGIPLTRPLWFDFPDDPTLRSIEDEMLVGDGLLAAPVIRDAGWERTVTLPAGGWYHYWSGARFEGGRSYLVDAPPDQRDGLPLFVREGTVMVYGPTADRCRERPEQPLRLSVYPGRARSGSLLKRPGQPAVMKWAVAGSCLTVTGGEAPLKLLVKQGGTVCPLELACNETKIVEEAGMWMPGEMDVE